MTQWGLEPQPTTQHSAVTLTLDRNNKKSPGMVTTHNLKGRANFVRLLFRIIPSNPNLSVILRQLLLPASFVPNYVIRLQHLLIMNQPVMDCITQTSSGRRHCPTVNFIMPFIQNIFFKTSWIQGLGASILCIHSLLFIGPEKQSRYPPFSIWCKNLC